jgi:hypothetical protein
MLTWTDEVALKAAIEGRCTWLNKERRSLGVAASGGPRKHGVVPPILLGKIDRNALLEIMDAAFSVAWSGHWRGHVYHPRIPPRRNQSPDKAQNSEDKQENMVL